MIFCSIVKATFFSPIAARTRRIDRRRRGWWRKWIDSERRFESAHDYERFQNPRVLALEEKVQLIGDEAMERSGPRFQGQVEVILKDGKVLHEHVSNCRGRPEKSNEPR